jgi:hypothetical protein
VSDAERTGRRDLLMSRWHRKESVGRWLTKTQAAMLEKIDIDSAEACPFCHHTIALIEEKNSTRSPESFTTRNTRLLADDAKIPAYCVTYTCVCGVAGEGHETRDECDVARVQLMQIAPVRGEVQRMQPECYAKWLLSLREACECLHAA